MTFKSIADLKQYIILRMHPAITQAMDEVYNILDEAIKGFYSDYDPHMYHRTRQLLHSLVRPEIVSTGNGYIGRVYFDGGKMSYWTGAKPSGQQVLETAMAGGHGATGLKVIGGTPVWSPAYSKIMAEIEPIIRSALIAAGIPIK